MAEKSGQNGQGTTHHDILVIGGGINGAGIARDAAGRGFSVFLCDRGDFGGGTSSASTKLVHGGLRYLEHFEFHLVRESLMEREVLWQMAPHIIWPLRFILPYHSGLRPAWMLRLGLFLYDHMGGRKLLPGTRTVNLRNDPTGKPLKPVYTKGFEYSDCWVEDSRMVILNLQDARAKGADIRPRTEVKTARFEDSKWRVTLRDVRTGKTSEVSASLVVNATGPYVDEVLKSVFGHNNAHHVRLVRGSHIVIGKKYQHDRCYILQNADERIIFAIPYEGKYTLIGTTDAEHVDLSKKPHITSEEIDYLCAMASEYFTEPVTNEDIVWTYSGVRPLFDDGASKAQEATRDYVIRFDKELGHGRLINIFGGKITTFRRLAESVMHDVEAVLGKRNPAWTRGAVLPGGDFPVTGYDALVDKFTKQFGFVDVDLMKRLVRHYGTEVAVMLDGLQSKEDLGEDFGCGLFEAEVRYLADHEWAMEAEDVVFRRTRLGIAMSDAEIGKVGRWLAAREKTVARPRSSS